MTFRSFLFWLHLAAGLISGLSIGIMCFTGTVLAFEKELVAWAERDARQFAPPPASTPRLTLDDLQAKVQTAFPDARPTSVVVQNNPTAALAFTAGRSGGFYVNPYTGEVRRPASTAMSGFMHTMTDLHRYLGLHGDSGRPFGKLVNGICNLAFFVLAVTGLYLWLPRSWSWRAVRPVIWFRQNSNAKARDFNWHNAIGFWTAPILIVLTLTAVPISFRWGGTLINTLTGTPPPAGTSGPGAARGGGAGPGVLVPRPASGAPTLGLDALLVAAQQAIPTWKTLTLRLPSAGPAGGRGPGSQNSTLESQVSNTSASQAPAVTFTARTTDSWPRTATTTLVLNPFTGAVVQKTGYADLNAAQQVRAWTRFLHTGEALGPIGQFVAGVASLGGVFLVYTGFALSWRRLFGRKDRAPRSVPAREPQEASSTR
jgi:uncharacterized iron-regulated membrane protein